ncbi:protein pegasus-like [Lycorma delicatula]|uniref:protein pegasus-like n=1 Tax=Lycorma delicatula TaxID=130591 RepID=UPI003F515D02
MNRKLLFLSVLIWIPFVSSSFEKSDSSCSMNCDENLSPICARKGFETFKTFDNLCFMLLENCRKNSDFIELYKGECDTERYIAPLYR